MPDAQSAAGVCAPRPCSFVGAWGVVFRLGRGPEPGACLPATRFPAPGGGDTVSRTGEGRGRPGVSAELARCNPNMEIRGREKQAATNERTNERGGLQARAGGSAARGGWLNGEGEGAAMGRGAEFDLQPGLSGLVPWVREGGAAEGGGGCKKGTSRERRRSVEAAVGRREGPFPSSRALGPAKGRLSSVGGGSPTRRGISSQEPGEPLAAAGPGRCMAK